MWLSALYPVNAMRNRALAGAETDVVLLLDVDFWPRWGQQLWEHSAVRGQVLVLAKAMCKPRTWAAQAGGGPAKTVRLSRCNAPWYRLGPATVITRLPFPSNSLPLRPTQPNPAARAALS